MSRQTWTPFWWESNAWFGAVSSQEDWREACKHFAEGHRLRTQKEACEMMLRLGAVAVWDHPAVAGEAGELPSIGCRREHIGGKPFKVWLVENDMYELLIEAVDRPSWIVRLYRRVMDFEPFDF